MNLIFDYKIIFLFLWYFSGMGINEDILLGLNLIGIKDISEAKAILKRKCICCIRYFRDILLLKNIG